MTTTWNPADLATLTLSNGNLTFTGTSPGQGGTRSTTSKTSGKFHYEGTINTNSGSDAGFGIGLGTATLAGLASNGTGGVICYTNFSGGQIWINGSGSAVSLGAASNGDVIAMEMDFTAKLFWAARNAGNWNNSGTANPATGVGGLSFSALTGTFFAAGTTGIGTVGTGNFGASAFSRAVSSGFTAWDVPVLAPGMLLG